jgi:hypothetical protein
MTPYEAITGRKPDLSKLHVFGSTCYAYVPIRKKLDPRARRGTFLGYDKYSPANYVLFQDTGEIKKIRCVKFTDQFSGKHSSDEEGEEFDGGPDVNEQEDDGKSEETNVPQLQAEAECRRNPPRERKAPKKFEDYVTVTVDYCYKAVMNIPTTYEEASQSEDHTEWEEAMKKEIEALKENDTYKLVELPHGAEIIGGKWVYTLKETADGHKVHKARFVARGFSQTEGVDYDEVYSPTAKMTSLRMIMQLAAQYNMKIEQMDVKSAYLNAPVEHEIYVQQPKGFQVNDGKNMVWKLKKSLYGLKQSGRNWNQLIDQTLRDMKFEGSEIDPCVYFKRSTDEQTFILIWVDDIIIASNDQKGTQKIKQELMSKFRMKDLGKLKNFLGIEFEDKDNEIVMKQTKYLMKVLQRFGMEECKAKDTPCEMKLEFTEENNHSKQHNYREMIGSLIYLMTVTRPDLCYIVSKLSQYLDRPTAECFVYAKHVLRYLKGSIDYGLHFRKSTEGLKITGYSDSDWGSDKDRRSISGICFTLNAQEGPLISWRSKKQTLIALSSCEAEYISLSLATQEAVFLKQLLKELDPRDHGEVILHCDNQGAIALSSKKICNQRSKHIDIRYHFVRNAVLEHLVNLEYVSSENNVADLFTKPMGRSKLKNFLSFIFGGCIFVK